MSTPYLGGNALSVTAVGSRVTCAPSPTNTDRDWLVLVTPEKWNDFCAYLFAAGWECGGSDIPDEVNEIPPELRFSSFTLGIENIIATQSEDFHRRFIAATSVSQRLNLMDKADRIALFQAVLYGNPCFVPEDLTEFA